MKEINELTTTWIGTTNIESRNTPDANTVNQLTDVLSSDLVSLQQSINVDYVQDKPWSTMRKDWVRRMISNNNLHWAYMIDMMYNAGWKYKFQEFYGIDMAFQLLQGDNPPKVVIMAPLLHQKVIESGFLWEVQIDPLLDLLKTARFNDESSKISKYKWLLQNSNCRFIEIPYSIERLNSVFDNITAPWDLLIQQKAEQNLWAEWLKYILHALHPSKISDPYNPKTSREEWYLRETMILAKQYFPGLDTAEKVLDYVLNINIDIPEVMKWKRIEWVYVDVDGTLIDYVPIWSPLEWTQQLKPAVVALLKEYEAQWKSITVWTWGDVKKKEAHLRSLWITRPVVSKYDHAWAIAEIVLDDTDRGAFVTQSKIYPETYINVNKL